jgi:hypothetical protein
MIEYNSIIDNENAKAHTIFDNIPAELKALRQWVCWKRETVEGRLTKVPYKPDGYKADSTLPETWTTYQQSVAALPRFDGIGFVLTANDPYCGTDIDHCVIDGKPSPYAIETLRRLTSYAEISPSGQGVRIICKARKHTERCKHREKGIEIYDQERFLTMTGNRIGSFAIEDRQAEIDQLCNELWPPKEEKTVEPKPNDLEDAKLIELAHNAVNGDKFRALYEGDWKELTHYRKTDGDLDHSSMDMALCSMLAFWTGGDPERIDRIYRNSALMRDKWERVDYRERTINKAIEDCQEFYKPIEKEPEPNWEEVFKGTTSPEPEEAQPEKPKRLEAYHIKDLYRLPKMVWQIEKHLFAGSRILVYGRWGNGKSFVVTDMALSTSHGVKFLGKYKTQSMPVDRLSTLLESPTMVVVHNNGKDDTRGARGSIRLMDDSDTIFEISAKKKANLIESIKVCNEKQKDGEPLKDYGLIMETIELDGEDDGSAVVIPADLWDYYFEKLNENQQETLKVCFGFDTEYNQTEVQQGGVKVARSTLYEHLTKLKEFQLIREDLNGLFYNNPEAMQWYNRRK